MIELVNISVEDSIEALQHASELGLQPGMWESRSVISDGLVEQKKIKLSSGASAKFLIADGHVESIVGTAPKYTT